MPLQPLKKTPSMEKNHLQEYYDSIAYYGDYIWGKSRNYLMPYWSTKYTASQITDNIFISDLPSAFNKECLRENGITHVLNLILGIDSLFPDDFVYKNIPARDVQRQDLGQYFDECVTFIDTAIKDNGKILVHCSQGISRSASIVIAYLIKIQDMSYDDAYSLVKEKRSMINPNPGFKEQLHQYEAKCRNGSYDVVEEEHEEHEEHGEESEQGEEIKERYEETEFDRDLAIYKILEDLSTSKQ